MGRIRVNSRFYSRFEKGRARNRLTPWMESKHPARVYPVRQATGGALGPLCEFLLPYGFHFVASYTDFVDTEGEMFVVANALLARR